MEKKSTKVLEDGNLRKYADHHLNLFHLKFFKKTRKNPKNPRAGPGFFRPGPRVKGPGQPAVARPEGQH